MLNYRQGLAAHLFIYLFTRPLFSVLSQIILQVKGPEFTQRQDHSIHQASFESIIWLL